MMKTLVGAMLVNALLSASAFAQVRSGEPLPSALIASSSAHEILAAAPAVIPLNAMLRAGLDQEANTPPAKRDGLANGIWIGLLVGLGVGAATDPIACRHSSERGDCENAYGLVIVPIFGAGGAVVGALIDRAFTNPPQTTQVNLGHSRFRVSASARRGQRSLALDVGF